MTPFYRNISMHKSRCAEKAFPDDCLFRKMKKKRILHFVDSMQAPVNM